MKLKKTNEIKNVKKKLFYEINYYSKIHTSNLKINLKIYKNLFRVSQVFALTARSQLKIFRLTTAV